MEAVKLINLIIGTAFFVCYLYQFVYIFIALIKKDKGSRNDGTLHRYAFLIPARNEQNVICNLIESIKNQKYPAELLDIYVVADNCDDATADAARAAGAVVYERFNKTEVGKGYALNFLIDKIKREHADRDYDGYFVFDADNVLDENYVSEMNKTYCDGYRVITSYRNSKNYGDNWISAGYSLWFLREAKYLNYPRYLIGSSCAVSGTGFMFSREILNKIGNWNYYLLTEDIEFTIASIIDGEKIGYSPNAVFYDEQPVRFSQSWKQRLRWAKGYYQVFGKYGSKLAGGIFKGRGFSFYDMTMTICPAIVLTAFAVIVNLAAAIWSLFAGENLFAVILSLLNLGVGTYIMLFIVGGITTITEWKKIYCPAFKKILYVFTFPVFMFTYIPISIAAFFKKVEWQHIEHTKNRNINEIKKATKL